MKGPSRFSLLFGSLAALCLALVGWWIFFLVDESHRFEEAAALLRNDRVAEAIAILGGGNPDSLEDAFGRRRTMFIAEGATFAVVIVVSIVIFFLAVLRERRMRIHQERFLSGATHSLKTPLATLRLGIESIAAGTLPEAKRETYLNDLLREVDRLQQGVTNILASANHRSGVRLHLEPGDLAIDVTSCTEEMQPYFERAGIELRTGELPTTLIDRDPKAMQTVVENLLDNALKFCRQGDSVKLGLTTDRDKAHLTVTDTGSGITSEDLLQVFERFYRGARKLEVGGTGLGLHLAKELVEAHGGQISAQSNGAGTGTTMRVTLPYSGAPR